MKTNPYFGPLIAIHGGLGLTHYYLIPPTHLSENYSIPKILYDQIKLAAATPHTYQNSLESSKFGPSRTFFYALLEKFVACLGLKEFILGSSWCEMMSSNFAALNPPGLRRFILANSLPV
jgi:pimeloyl-ACP methyl ester carboxylesterase